MARGDGYIRKRGKDSWSFTIWLGRDENGRPRQKTMTVRGSYKNALAEKARLIADRDRGIDLKPLEATFAELTQRWREAKYPSLSPNTQATYETNLAVHVLPVLGMRRLRDIRPLHIEAVKTAVIQRGCSPKTARNVFLLVKAILKQAVRWQLLSTNPGDMIEPPKARKFIPRTPSPEELSNLLLVVDKTAYGPLARLAALTGCRQGELLRLLWRDVSWEYETLNVRGTKTEASVRTVELAELAMNLLREHRTKEREKRLKLGPLADCGADNAPIFTNAVGKAMDAGGLKRTWKRLRDKGLIPPVRFHDLRHALASYLLMAGVPLQLVAKVLGHSRTSTTSDIYAHVLPGTARLAADTIDRVMGNTWSTAKEA